MHSIDISHRRHAERFEVPCQHKQLPKCLHQENITLPACRLQFLPPERNPGHIWTKTACLNDEVFKSLGNLWSR